MPVQRSLDIHITNIDMAIKLSTNATVQYSTIVSPIAINLALAISFLLMDNIVTSRFHCIIPTHPPLL